MAMGILSGPAAYFSVGGATTHGNVFHNPRPTIHTICDPGSSKPEKKPVDFGTRTRGRSVDAHHTRGPKSLYAETVTPRLMSAFFLDHRGGNDS